MVADGYCDDDTNNLACNYDGGDCCGYEVLEDYCDDCDCLEGWDEVEGQKLLLFFDWLTLILSAQKMLFLTEKGPDQMKVFVFEWELCYHFFTQNWELER